MEVCGTHTVSAFRTGLRSLLPSDVALLSGPGCPVCVTETGYLDHAIAIARRKDVIIATFGDMLRVPGSAGSLETARAAGARIVVVYSPMDALKLAVENPEAHVVFLGVGFETTAPTVAWTIREAAHRKYRNYSVLCAHKLIPPAMVALLESGVTRIDGFMCPGHVSIIIGAHAYEPVARRFGVPCVVSGFEAADMAECIAMLLRQVETRTAEVQNQYHRSVTATGNTQAQNLLADVFEPCDAPWRGLGTIPNSGLRIRPKYAACDAGIIFGDMAPDSVAEPKGCRCGEVLRGICLPPDCRLFGRACTPDTPIGPCMVSSEGTCSAHFRYGRTV